MRTRFSSIARPVAVLAAYGAVSLILVRPSFSGRTDFVPWDVLGEYPPWGSSPAAESRPHNALIADIVFQSLPWQRWNRESLEHGDRARWNPHILCGQPLYSGLLYGYRYPPDFLRRTLEPARAAAWMMAFHLTLGAFFCALLTRRFGAGWPGAALAGWAYALSGPVYLNMTFHTMQGTLAWLPGCAFAVKGLLDAAGRPAWRPRAAWALFAGTAHAMSALSGHLEITLYTCLFTGALVAWNLVLRRRAGFQGAAAWPLAALLAAFAAIAWIVRPEITALSRNFRADSLPPEAVRAHGLPVYQVAGFLAPDFCGSPVQHRFFDPFERRIRAPDRYAEKGPVDWGDRNAVEGAVYWGILPLALLACAGWRRRPTRFFWFGLAAAGLLAFGAPLYTLVYHGVPFVRQLRTPVRWMIPATLCAAVLAGCGLETAKPGGPMRGRFFRTGRAALALAAGLFSLALAAFVFRSHAARLAAPVLEGAYKVREIFSGPDEFLAFSLGRILKSAGWIAATGAAILWIAGPNRRSAWMWLAPALLAADLAVRHGAFFPRTTDEPVRDPPPAIRALQAQPGLFRIAAFGETRILPPNTAALFGFHDIRGYESVMDRRYLEFLCRMEPQPDLIYNQAGRLRDPATLASPWLGFLNVEFLLSDRPVRADGWELFFDEGIRIYRNRNARPRYYLSLSLPQTFDEGPPPVFEGGSARIVSYTPDRVRLLVDTPEPAWLVSSDTDLGFWRPIIDGAPAESDPLLGVFRCVRLGPGRQVVEWRLHKP